MDLAAVLLIWVSLGIPWKWKKFKGGYQLDWIGYYIDFETYYLGISVKRAEWLVNWCDKTVAEKKTRVADLRAVLGRLCFALGALEYLRPFTVPIYSWVAAGGGWPCLPPLVGLFPAQVYRR